MSKTIDNMDLIEYEPLRNKPTDKDIVLEFDDGVALSYLQHEYNRRHPKEVYWTMGNGSTINIKDMSDEHLLNAIKFIKRKNDEREMFDMADCFMDF